MECTLQERMKFVGDTWCTIYLYKFIFSVAMLVFSCESFDVHAVFAGSRKWLRFQTFSISDRKPQSETLGAGMHLQSVLLIWLQTCSRQCWNCGNHTCGTL